MATTGAPPPPPPLPGTMGAMTMPNWREHPFPVRESAPSKEQIDKQQYAHLPDKLLNSMNKDKKPFTYTPSGVGEKGVLDLTEIRSPRMKKRLIANLNNADYDELTTTDEEGSRPGSSCSKPIQPPTKNLYQQPFNPCVLPPLDSNKLRPNSPNPPQREKKEVRFAPSPILLSDDEELCTKLEKRRLDVEARSKICTNQPESEPTQQQQLGAPPPPPVIQSFTPQSFPSPTPPPPPPQQYNSIYASVKAPSMNQSQEPTKYYEEPEMSQLVANASAAVQSARKLYSNQPYQSPASPVFDTNNNPTSSQNGNAYESPPVSLPSPPPSAQFPPAPPAQPQLQSVPPTHLSQSVEQQTQPSECNVNSSNGANCTDFGQQQETQQQQPPYREQTEEEMRQMINQIESELSEMRLKEHSQQTQHQAQAQMQQSRPSTSASAQRSSPPTGTVESDQARFEPLDAPSAFTPVAAPLPPPPPPPAMQAYQQRPYSQGQPPQRAEPYNKQQQTAILENLFNDMQDEIAKFEQISREAAIGSPAPPAAAPSYSNARTNDYEGFQTVQVARKGPCGAPQAPPKPARGGPYGGPVGDDGRTSCPPFQHEHVMDPSDGNIRCITPSSEFMKKTQTSSNYTTYNQSARPFAPYRASTEEPLAAYQSLPLQRELYQAEVVTLPPQPSAPAQAPAAPTGRSRRAIPFAFKNQLPRPAEDVAPEIAEERIASVQQQIAERELYAHQARNRAVKTTKNFVNQCSNEGYRESHTLPRTMHLAPQPGDAPIGNPQSYNDTESNRAFLSSANMYSQLPPGAEPASPNSPTSPNSKMYYGSLPRKVKLNHRGQLAEPATPPPPPAKSYVNNEEGRQFLNDSGMYSQLPPVLKPVPESPRTRPMSQPTPGYGRLYENKEEGRSFISGSKMYSQLPPGSQNQSHSFQPIPENTAMTNSHGSNEEGRSFLPGGSMFSQLPFRGQSHEPSRAPMYQTTPTGPQEVNARSYVDKEEGRAFLQTSLMYSQLPPGAEPGTSNGPYSPAPFYNSFDSMKRQSSLPPPMNRGSTQIWTPPPTPPLPPVVNTPAYQQQQPKLSLQQIRRLPPSERPVEPTPSKYTGSHIPSRSFRLLQLITGEDIENQYASPQEAAAPPAQPQRPASSMASYGRPQTKPPEPPVRANNVNQFHTNQPNVSYSSMATLADDHGTDF